jgi:hypothetical protein
LQSVAIGIRLMAEAIMPGILRSRRVESSPTMMKIVELFQREVDKRVGVDATFEQWQDAAAAFAAEVLDEAAEEDQAEGQTEVTHVQQRTHPKGRPQQPDSAKGRGSAG